MSQSQKDCKLFFHNPLLTLLLQILVESFFLRNEETLTARSIADIWEDSTMVT